LELNDKTLAELAEYLQMRYARCNKNIELLGDVQTTLSWFTLIWERDFFRDKFLEK